MMCPTSSASKQYMETGTEYVSIADDTSLASVQSLMLQLITFDLFGKPYVAPTASVAVKTANRRLKSAASVWVSFACSHTKKKRHSVCTYVQNLGPWVRAVAGLKHGHPAQLGLAHMRGLSQKKLPKTSSNLAYPQSVMTRTRGSWLGEAN